MDKLVLLEIRIDLYKTLDKNGLGGPIQVFIYLSSFFEWLVEMNHSDKYFNILNTSNISFQPVLKNGKINILLSPQLKV